MTEPGHTIEHLLDSCRAPILRYVLSICHDHAMAEDLVQETFLKAHKSRDSLTDESRALSWLYRIATNVCHDRYRRDGAWGKPRSRDVETLDGAEQDNLVMADEPRLDKALEQEEMSSCVQSYLAALPDSYRAVILFHDAEGMTNQEIATMLGVSLAAAKIRLHRAREKLREALSRACSFSSDERGVLICDPKPEDS